MMKDHVASSDLFDCPSLSTVGWIVGKVLGREKRWRKIGTQIDTFIDIEREKDKEMERERAACGKLPPPPLATERDFYSENVLFNGHFSNVRLRQELCDKHINIPSLVIRKENIKFCLLIEVQV